LDDRARPNQAHLTGQYMKQLWQLVQAGAP
jgi:hypothetical protein